MGQKTRETAAGTAIVLEKPEKKRIYHYPDGTAYEIEGVVEIIARPSGTHRVKDAKGRLHITRANWTGIEILSDDWQV